MHNSSPHPLVDGLRRAGSISPYFNLPIRDPQQEDWISGEDLFLGNDQRLRNLVRTYGQAFWGSSNSHVAGSAFIIAYLTRLVWPVIGQWVREGQVPDVTLGNIVFPPTRGGGRCHRYGPPDLRHSCRKFSYWTPGRNHHRGLGCSLLSAKAMASCRQFGSGSYLLAPGRWGQRQNILERRGLRLRPSLPSPLPGFRVAGDIGNPCR